MASNKISNEMLYDLIKLGREDFQDFKHDMREFKRESHEQLSEIRADIAGLNQNKITWNAGLLAGVIAMSSLISILLIRFLSVIGVKVAAWAQFVLV